MFTNFGTGIFLTSFNEECSMGYITSNDSTFFKQYVSHKRVFDVTYFRRGICDTGNCLMAEKVREAVDK